jgi:hypothetical protein
MERAKGILYLTLFGEVFKMNIKLRMKITKEESEIIVFTVL